VPRIIGMQNVGRVTKKTARGGAGCKDSRKMMSRNGNQTSIWNLSEAGASERKQKTTNTEEDCKRGQNTRRKSTAFNQTRGRKLA